MTTNNLTFKDKTIRGNDLELIFHKGVRWIYDEQPFPVVKYTLTNCKNLDAINFESIDYYNDGVDIATWQQEGILIFESTEIGDVKVKIFCDKIEREEREYNSKDYVELLNEITRQRDNEYRTSATLTQQAETLMQFLTRELDIVIRKLTQAEWLTEDKKHFLRGQQEFINKTLETLNKK